MLCNPMGCIVHGILQARILKWVAVPFSRGSSQPRDQTQVSLIAGRRIFYQLSHKGSPRIQEWVAYPTSSRSSRPRNWTRVSCTAGRFFTNWAMREAPGSWILVENKRVSHSILIQVWFSQRIASGVSAIGELPGCTLSSPTCVNSVPERIYVNAWAAATGLANCSSPRRSRAVGRSGKEVCGRRLGTSTWEQPSSLRIWICVLPLSFHQETFTREETGKRQRLAGTTGTWSGAVVTGGWLVCVPTARTLEPTDSSLTGVYEAARQTKLLYVLLRHGLWYTTIML